MITKFFRLIDPKKEICCCVESPGPLSAEAREALVGLLSETYEPRLTRGESFLKNESIVIIGPRLNFETPFSSNAASMLGAMGFAEIGRVEIFTRYLADGEAGREAIVAAHLDRMTQAVCTRDIESLGLAASPEPVRIISVLEEGDEAIRKFSKEAGLGMDGWDIRHWSDLFRRYGRNPTDAELFDIGNGNSDHSRHWFFRGRLVIGGAEMPQSLMDLMKAPLSALEAKGATNVKRAFCDNAGVIKGHWVSQIVPVRPGEPSEYILRQGLWHIAATAETHNHPTKISPYPGAATGSGGRIRDNSAVGRGAITVAGSAGYCTGDPRREESLSFATPLQILTKGSDGVSDYGNCYGEPLIAGFARTFDLPVGGERRAWLKPVLYSGGLSRILDSHVEKHQPEKGMLIVRIGGPAYRIGVGGGSASSMSQGQNSAELDLKSVQRGNPEMERKTNNVIRACVEMGYRNPIESIHDQGAGGPSNVLKELMEPAGGRVDIAKICLGDKTLSVLEIWVAEYQEGYGLLIRPERIEEFKAICARERVNCEMLGEITGDGRAVVADSRDGSTPIDFSLEDVLGKLPRKTFEFERLSRKFEPLAIPRDLTAAQAIERTLGLLQVGSKRCFTRKVDRSVGGLVAQQQCCGPMQIPVADCGVAALSHFDAVGAAMALGEQPALIDPEAAARMALCEALTNIAAAGVGGISDIKCHVNWMWPAKLPGEGARLYDAVSALSMLMAKFGIAPTGGKDSLSMSAEAGGELVKAPGEVVVKAYAPVSDVTKSLTPDFKHPGESAIGFIDLGRGKNRLGGSAFACALGQAGDTPPDLEDEEYFLGALEGVLELLRRGFITAYHDRSGGGLAASLIEMCLAANCGADIDLWASGSMLPALFAEELGMFFEYSPENEEQVGLVLEAWGARFECIGKTSLREEGFTVKQYGKTVLHEKLEVLRKWWEAPSTFIEERQANPEVVREEEQSFLSGGEPDYRLSFVPEETPAILVGALGNPKVAILREEGTNGERELAAACAAAGLAPSDVAMQDLLEGNATLDEYQGVMFPGGFSFMDVFGSAKGWAAVIQGGEIRGSQETLRGMFDRFYGRPDTFSFGPCNGCQLMALLGWVPFRGILPEIQPRFVKNRSGRFESQWSQVMILRSPSIMLCGMDGSILGVPVAHGEGRCFFPDEEILERVLRAHLVPLVYVDGAGKAAEKYPSNPNGSVLGIAGLCTPDGRHLAMMPHPERAFIKWQWHYMPERWKRDLKASPWLKMFQNARKWCLEQRGE